MSDAVENIAYITNARMPTEKAHGLQIANMCAAFAKAAKHVSLIVPDRYNDINKSVFSYYSIDFELFTFCKLSVPDMIRFSESLGSIAYYLQMLFFLARLLFWRAPTNTVIYTRDTSIAWLFSLRGYITVLGVHAPPTSKRTLFSWMLSFVDLVVCNSDGTQKAVEKLGAENTLVAPNGVSIEQFDLDISKQSAREKTDLPGDKKIVMYVGNLYEWKGVDTVIAAWNKKLHKQPQLMLVFVGGHDEDRKRLNDELAHPQRVQFIPPVPHEKVPYYLKSADVLLLPNAPNTEESRKYTSPIKLFEYMSVQRPIVASNLPSIRSIVSDKEVFFFSAGDPNSLANAVKKTWGRGMRKAAHARKKAQKYTWKKRAEKILRALHK